MNRLVTAALGMTLLLIPSGLGLRAAPGDLADAAMNGDTAAVGRLLTENADVDEPQLDGSTALHWTVYRDDLETSELLIGAGADVAVVTNAGVTPLHLASLYGNPGMIDILLRAGADAGRVGPNGETPLMLSARNGNPDALELLLDAGAEVNAREGLRGTTALMWAVEQRHPTAVKTLLDAGADFAMRSGEAGLPRNYMARAVNVAAVRAAQRAVEAGEAIPYELADAPAPGPNGLEPAQGAAVVDDEAEPVPGLVGGGGGGLTALVFAAREGDIETARFLIEAGADVDQVTEYGWSPVLTATNNRHYELGRFLIENGADLNIANRGGMTPLYLATDNRNIEGGDYPVPRADMDHLEYIQILLENGADPNARVSSNTETRTIFTQQWFFEPGATAFVRASQSGDTSLMNLLLEYGADPFISTDFGDSALAAAAGIGWVEGVTFEMSPEETVDAVRMLLELGLDPNSANGDGRTPLMGAAVKGRNPLVELLVESGARLETRDNGSRDSDRLGESKLAGVTWQAIDYAEGLVRVGVQSAVGWLETASLIRRLMIERGLSVPDINRTIDSICITLICQQEQQEGLER